MLGLWLPPFLRLRRWLGFRPGGPSCQRAADGVCIAHAQARVVRDLEKRKSPVRLGHRDRLSLDCLVRVGPSSRARVPSNKRHKATIAGETRGPSGSTSTRGCLSASVAISSVRLLKGGLRPHQRLYRWLGPGWVFTGLEYQVCQRPAYRLWAVYVWAMQVKVARDLEQSKSSKR